jgi:hypothetical protein
MTSSTWSGEKMIPQSIRVLWEVPVREHCASFTDQMSSHVRAKDE